VMEAVRANRRDRGSLAVAWGILCIDRRGSGSLMRLR
jgi:hypothetical protein